VHVELAGGPGLGSVDDRLESGVGLVERFGEPQVADDGLVEALSRDEQRDARRVGREQHGGGGGLQRGAGGPGEMAAGLAGPGAGWTGVRRGEAAAGSMCGTSSEVYMSVVSRARSCAR